MATTKKIRDEIPKRVKTKENPATMNKHFIFKENFHFNPKELVQSGFCSDELVLYVP